jgi:lipopolysaccharide assembly outer membrane protein LptD (OstA)
MPRTHLTLLTAQIAIRRKLFALSAGILALMALPTAAQQVRLPSGRGQYAELSSEGPQSRKGDLFIADKNVDLQYAGVRLRADHAEYNDKTHESAVQGHIVFDYENQHLEADQAH